MKYCPQCKRQFDEPWLSFCSDDGTPLIQELTPPKDPNWDPSIREPKRETKVDTPSEKETQWLPRQPPMPGGWIAPDERPPMNPPVWQPPPPPPYQTVYTQPSQALGVASMVTAIAGFVFGLWCFGPLPGIAALIMGLIALSQNKKSPEKVGGKQFARAGVIIGSIDIAFYLLFFIWMFWSLIFG